MPDRSLSGPNHNSILNQIAQAGIMLIVIVVVLAVEIVRTM